MRVDFAEYNRETVQLIGYVLARVDEDDVLAGAMRRPRLIRAVWLVGPLRDNVNEYRTAVHRVVATTGWRRRGWMLVARYSACSLRWGARQYEDRGDYDPRWRRAPRPLT